MENLITAINSVLVIIYAYIPKLFAGIIILLIGLIIASILKDLIGIIFKYFRIEKWLSTAKIAKEEEVKIWPQIVAELVRWMTIFIFLISAVEVWGVPKVGDVLNQLLNFLPNVFLTVVIGWVGLVAGKLGFNIVRHGVRGLGNNETFLLGNVAKYSIIFFTILIILTQLGVAADLVKILFTGIISMLALAFGLSFGLGGQDEARRILKTIHEKFDSQSQPKELIKKEK
ncbi:hypothetical protein A3D03_05335 [Candidatus Gottesmanbacteria bacterium RIFCSPHIGHO2_02_FULL_40_13]|uniref:Small-conductance mechanosensitive ion channel n=1 Tax=Candidatus Gottesmanbacteria bacterium RIFCSPHIGHO2_02_FULL_40_13 TaxID=1798384 RepID=A0A1F6A7E8_9BACT|nr:MAG: hypothetical protein A3D03_05335 [Candidatus Gottesmanbacteria bacterium RIFCSPHIGHO2_02_FULL_40_13]